MYKEDIKQKLIICKAIKIRVCFSSIIRYFYLIPRLNNNYYYFKLQTYMLHLYVLDCY